MSRLDKYAQVAKIVAAFASIIGVTVAIIVNWDKLQPKIASWPLHVLGVILLLAVLVLLIVSKRQGIMKALKPKPRLVITVRDINCYVESRVVPHHNLRGLTEKVRETTWQVELTAKIRNKKRTSATNVVWQAKLILGQGDNAFNLTEIETQRRNFNLAKGEVHQLLIRFKRKEFFEKESGLYPNGPYRLEYTYSCDEHPRSQKVTHRSGRLKKADWIRDPRIGDPNSLRIVKNMGFSE